MPNHSRRTSPQKLTYKHKNTEKPRQNDKLQVHVSTHTDTPLHRTIYKPYFFSERIVFFSRNNSVNSKRTGHLSSSLTSRVRLHLPHVVSSSSRTPSPPPITPLGSGSATKPSTTSTRIQRRPPSAPASTIPPPRRRPWNSGETLPPPVTTFFPSPLPQPPPACGHVKLPRAPANSGHRTPAST